MPRAMPSPSPLRCAAPAATARQRWPRRWPMIPTFRTPISTAFSGPSLAKSRSNLLVDHLRPHQRADRRAARARDDQCRRGQARRSPGRPPHPDGRRRRLARAGPAAVPARRAATTPAGHDADRQRSAGQGRAPDRSTRCRRARRCALLVWRPAAGSGRRANARACRPCRSPRRMAAALEARQRLPARPRRQGRRAAAGAIAASNKRLDEKGLTAFDAATRPTAPRRSPARSASASSFCLTRERAALRRAWRVSGGCGHSRRRRRTPVGGDGGLEEIETEDLLRRLYDLSLLLGLDLGQAQLSAARHHPSLPAGPGREGGTHCAAQGAVAVLSTASASAEDRADSRATIYLHLPHHLAEADEREKLDTLLLDPGWLKAKLAATGNPSALVARLRAIWRRRGAELHRPNAAADGGIRRARSAPADAAALAASHGSKAASVPDFLETARDALSRPAILPSARA